MCSIVREYLLLDRSEVYMEDRIAINSKLIFIALSNRPYVGTGYVLYKYMYCISSLCNLCCNPHELFA